MVSVRGMVVLMLVPVITGLVSWGYIVVAL